MIKEAEEHAKGKRTKTAANEKDYAWISKNKNGMRRVCFQRCQRRQTLNVCEFKSSDIFLFHHIFELAHE
jgi:hypothetical protein